MNIANDKEIRIEKLTLGIYETNTYIVVCQKTKAKSGGGCTSQSFGNYCRAGGHTA